MQNGLTCDFLINNWLQLKHIEILDFNWKASLFLLSLFSFLYLHLFSRQNGYFPTSRLGHTLNLVSDGHVLLYGGRERVDQTSALASQMFADCTPANSFSYDIETGAWLCTPMCGDIPWGGGSIPHHHNIFQQWITCFGWCGAYYTTDNNRILASF